MQQDELGWKEMSKAPLILDAGGRFCHAGTVRVDTAACPRAGQPTGVSKAQLSTSPRNASMCG